MNLTYVNKASVQAKDRSLLLGFTDEGVTANGLLRILGFLDERGYDFIAPTPASHSRVVRRPERQVGHTITDLFGWNIPCRVDELGELIPLLEAARVIDWQVDGTIKARIRVSRVMGKLFIHSAFPTDASDSVFLGPDSHRFADFIVRNMEGLPQPVRILDYGAGAGVGGIVAASHHGQARLTLADINPKALAFASINAAYAGVKYAAVSVEEPGALDQSFDLIVMHPPFMIDPGLRAYRDGGDLYGGRLSVDWALAGASKLALGGRLVMHTGASIIGGKDMVQEALSKIASSQDLSLDYRLLDPDIFGEELDTPVYAEVDRIAAVGLCIVRDRSRAYPDS